MLLSGDHFLSRISSSVSAKPVQRSNPLGDFLRSLQKVSGLPVDHVLPGHEYGFTSLDARTATLIEHHRERLSEIEDVVAKSPDASALEVASSITWSRPWSNMGERPQRMAAGETLAHLVLLEHQGRVARVGHAPAIWSID